MKRAATCPLLLLLIFILSFCRDGEELTSNSLVGKWQLVQQNISTGSAGEWINVSDGQIYDFKTDGSFTVSDDPLCTMGYYEVTNVLEKEGV